MRILVMSDTHGDRWALQQALQAQPKAAAVFHLGDGEAEARAAQAACPQLPFYLVRGNCDWSSSLPARLTVELGGKRFFLTHGYAENVKYGLEEALRAAREQEAQVLLFGHTHQPLSEYRDGLYVLNPGSLHGSSGSYGYVDVTSAGIVTNCVSLQTTW